MLSTNILRYGRDGLLPKQIELRAGPLSLIYEAGDLRYIRLNDQEIVRRIYVAVRDRNWGTVPPVRSNEQMDIGNDSFRITYDVTHKQGAIDFFWQGTISGDQEGTITFTMDGLARSTFLRNRIGFCVLHPIRQCAGQPCTIEHVGGRVAQGRFPFYISPHQPFTDMQAITHEVVPGVRAEVRFVGDVFEMEDQRNWTDASFKTYCTPLRLPFPVEVQTGTRIVQSVRLTLSDERPTTNDRRPTTDTSSVAFDLQPALITTPLPRIGLQTASHNQPLSQQEVARLKALNLAHLRVDLQLAQPDYASVLRQAAVEATELEVPLEIALVLSDAAAQELRSLMTVLDQVRPAVCAWLIFHVAEKSTSERWIALAREYLTHYNPDALIGGGTNAYFAELNRQRPPVRALDLVNYSINPQVHAFDNASLAETLEAQATTVASARQFIGSLPLAISPITLKPRFNPDATTAEPELAPDELPAQVDVRQMSLFGAGWTAGSLKYLAESGVASLTYYETTGWRGVMETEQGSPLPEHFRSLPGSVFPLYHILADVGEFGGGKVAPTISSNMLCVDGLAVSKAGKIRVILANLSATLQQVRLQNISTYVRVRYLNETNAEAAMRSPETFRDQTGEHMQTSAGALTLKLLPYAIVRVDMIVEQ